MKTKTGGFLLLSLAIAASFASFSSHGQGEAAMRQMPTTIDQARTLQERAKGMKAEAERQFELDRVECGKKVLVANCVESATTRKRAILTEAGKLDQSAREGERQIRRNEREAREAQRNADAPRREAEQAARIGQLHQDKQQHDANLALKQNQEAAEVARRRSRNEAEAAARLAKLDERARQEAELALTRPRRIQEQQQREREIAEHAAKIAERTRQHAEDLKKRETAAAEKRAAQETARKNAEERVSFLCQLWPERFCSGLGSGK